MKRDVRLEEISDGKLYTSSDMVKADCRGCVGCSSCCKGMGQSIVLDPMDVMRLTRGLGMDFAALIQNGKIELNLADGLILPNLKMAGKDEACTFLDEDGRCSIHAFRPGICRLFPLGRVYEEKGFRYFLQIHECPKKDRSKVKVRSWLETPNIKAYEDYIWRWHAFLLDCQEGSRELDEQNLKILEMYILKTFYENPYEEEDFYREFQERLEMARNILSV